MVEGGDMIEFKLFIATKNEFPFGESYGLAWPHKRMAYVRADLPWPALKFVLCHEAFHLTDSATWWVWREIKANFHAALCHPWGALVCLAMTIASPARWKYYAGRVVKGL